MMALKPELGSHVLELAITALDKDAVPRALERSFLAVDSPRVDLAPGTWVRISFWAKVPGTEATADGAVVYDTVGGEPLAVRLTVTKQWMKYHLYRQVPASGKIGVTFALTGLGKAYFDDVRIEPLMMSSSSAVIRHSSATPAWNSMVKPKPQELTEDQRTLPFPQKLPRGDEEVLPNPRKMPENDPFPVFPQPPLGEPVSSKGRR
jgi:hypothetical protein